MRLSAGTVGVVNFRHSSVGASFELYPDGVRCSDILESYPGFVFSCYPMLVFRFGKSPRCSVYLRPTAHWTTRDDIPFHILRPYHNRKEMSNSSPVPQDKKSLSRPLLKTHQPIDWYLDWDGTITKRDTLDVLVNIAAQQNTDVDVHKVWPELGRQYIEDANKLYEEVMKQPPATVEDEREFLKVMEAAEKRSIDRVSNSGIFKGLSPQNIIQGALQAVKHENVQIRGGYRQFCDIIKARTFGVGNSPDDRNVHAKEGDITQRKDLLTIISVNWSARFIEECMKATGVWPNTGEVKPEICANELEHVGSIAVSQRRSHESYKTASSDEKPQLKEMPSTGHIVPAPGLDSRIIFSRDKLDRFSKPQASDDGGNPVPKIYIGDSWTDLECLLAADLGICIRDDPMTSAQRKLAESFQRLGIQCHRLLDLLDQPEPITDRWKVVWVQDFWEITRWLQRVEEH